MKVPAESFYDDWADLYDVMIDWPQRLAADIPPLIQLFKKHEAGNILDAACGTGCHALELAAQGHKISGADINSRLLQRARRAAQKLAPSQRPVFARWDFAKPAPARLTAQGPFDAVFCLGNSFSHLTEKHLIQQSMNHFHQLLAPGGLILIQIKNMLRRKQQRQPQLPLLRRTLPGGETFFFIRFYDFEQSRPDIAEFHLVIQGPRTLQQATPLKIWNAGQFKSAFRAAGFRRCGLYSDLNCKASFNPESSEDIVALARA